MTRRYWLWRFQSDFPMLGRPWINHPFARGAGITDELARTRKGQPDSAADQETAAEPRDDPYPARREQRAGAANEYRIGRIGGSCHHHCGDAEQYDLSHIVAVGIDELRDEGAEQEQRLRVAHQLQESLPEKSDARRG